MDVGRDPTNLEFEVFLFYIWFSLIFSGFAALRLPRDS